MITNERITPEVRRLRDQRASNLRFLRDLPRDASYEVRQYEPKGKNRIPVLSAVHPYCHSHIASAYAQFFDMNREEASWAYATENRLYVVRNNNLAPSNGNHRRGKRVLTALIGPRTHKIKSVVRNDREKCA